MNPTPDPNATPNQTPFNTPSPFDAPGITGEAAAQAQTQATAQAKAREQAELEAKMALLPDYEDEAFPRRSSLLSASGAKPVAVPVHVEAVSGRGFGPELEEGVDAPAALVAGGCLGGVLSNIVLGFFLLVLQHAGVALYGPGVLAVVVALVVLGLVLGSWSKRVWLSAGGFLLGLLLSFGALFLFVRPALTAGAPAPASTSIAPANVPIANPQGPPS